MRVFAIAAAVLAAVALSVSIALWVFFSSWLPVRGKAWLIQELEHRFPVEISITTLRYDPLKGFVFEGVEIRDGLRDEVQGRVPYAQVQMNWLALAGRRLAFRGRMQAEQPADVVVNVAGRYHLKDRTLSLDLATTDTALASLGPPLRRFLPAELTAGNVRLRVHLRPSAQTLPIIIGRVDGTGLVWEQGVWRVQGDVRLDGTLYPPDAGRDRWETKADVALEGGRFTGPAFGGAPLNVDDLSGRGRVDRDVLTILELTGTMAGSPWRFEAQADLGSARTFDAMLQGSVKLAALGQAFPALRAGWDVDGQADLRAVCRGRHSDLAISDCVAEAKLRNATLASSRLPTAVTDVSGTIRAESLPRRISFEQLRGRVARERLQVSGDVRLGEPPTLTLELTGAVPLAMVRPWLPADTLVRALDGVADADLTVAGPLTALEYGGTVEFRDAAVGLTRPAVTLERVNGPISFAHDRIETPQLHAIVNGQALTAAIRVHHLEAPEFSGTVLFANGQMDLAGRLSAHTARIDEAVVRLGNSQVRLTGAIDRADGAGRVTLSGTVSADDLASVPFLRLPALAAWKVRGVAEIDAEFSGMLSHPVDGTLSARIRAPALAIREVPCEQLQATIQFQHRQLHMTIPAGTVAGGRLLGELLLTFREAGTDVSLQADIASLQLEQLGAAIPSWRERGVAGWASGRADLRGLWGSRASWQGDGWIDAQAERLGNIPLLDRVFQGLFGVLADRLGLDMLRRAQINKASIQWKLSDQRIWTDALRLDGVAGTQPVAIFGRGSVGLDQTLDLTVEPELPEGLALEAPTTAPLARTIMKAAIRIEQLLRLIGRHRITGTLKQPQYQFERSIDELVRQLLPTPAGLLKGLFEAR